jgi:hypothetical protein
MNESHRRVLTVYLANIERNLEKLQNKLGDGTQEYDGTLNALEKDLSIESINLILDSASHMGDEVRSEQQLFGLKRQPGSLSRYTNATLTEIWSTINDLRPNNFENYGPLTEEDKVRLDLLVSRLMADIDRMFSACK